MGADRSTAAAEREREELGFRFRENELGAEVSAFILATIADETIYILGYSLNILGYSLNILGYSLVHRQPSDRAHPTVDIFLP